MISTDADRHLLRVTLRQDLTGGVRSTRDTAKMDRTANVELSRVDSVRWITDNRQTRSAAVAARPDTPRSLPRCTTTVLVPHSFPPPPPRTNKHYVSENCASSARVHHVDGCCCCCCVAGSGRQSAGMLPYSSRPSTLYDIAQYPRITAVSLKYWVNKNSCTCDRTWVRLLKKCPLLFSMIFVI